MKKAVFAMMISAGGVAVYLVAALTGPGWKCSDDVCPGSTTSVMTVRELSSPLGGRGTRAVTLAAVESSLVSVTVG